VVKASETFTMRPGRRALSPNSTGGAVRKSANITRSKVRARVEHVFGHQENAMGGEMVSNHRHRAAKVQDRHDEPGYNLRRLVQMERAAAAPVWFGGAGGEIGLAKNHYSSRCP
jgi:hypothetical protein